MNSAEIRKKVKRFRADYGVRDITAGTLGEVFKKQGFTIIEYNPVLNDPDVAAVINNLGLSDMIAHSNGFLYMDSNYRLLFINEKLNEEERRILLAHEEGHYCCGHTSSQNVIGRSVQEEYEANEFAHFLLQKTGRTVALGIIVKYRKQLIIGLLLIGLAIGGGIATKEYHDRQIYEGEYYVTVHGEKYHRPGCVTIQGHETRRLTKEDVKTGDYEPCSVCQPDK